MSKTKRMSTREKLKIIMSEFELFAKNFIYIIDTSGKRVKLELNSAQKDLEKLMDNNRFVAVSKARKAGVSTYMLAKALYMALTKSDQSIVIVSYDGDSAKNLFEILKRMNDYLDREKFPDLFPKVRRDNRSELFFENNSRIVCTVAGYKELIRGFSPTWVHLSEFAFYSNQEKQLLSVEQALVDNGQISIETTSNGIGNYWYRLYSNAVKGQSKYKPYFIPWYHEFYNKSMKNQYDEAEKWYREDNKGSRLSRNDLDDYERSLFEKGVTLRQLMFRRYKLLDMTLQEFQQEMPAFYQESFISTGNSVFSQSKILERLNYTIEPLNTNEVYDELPDVLKPYLNKGLYIYHLPKRGKFFGGVDSASGSGGDFSTVSIFDADGQQVASFFRNDVPVYRFAEIVDALGRWYYQAFLVVERNNVGLPLLERLRKDHNYMNLYKGKIFDQRGRRKLQLGFATTATTKAVLINDFKEQFELNMINIECRETLEQMQIYQETDGKMGNKRGENNHDDLVISCALAIQGMKSGKWYVDV